MDKTVKYCKCGKPVQNIINRQFYKKKDGTLSIYLVRPTYCQACVNKRKRQLKIKWRQDERTLTAY